MSDNDLQRRNWEILSNTDCDYCDSEDVQIMEVVPHEQTQDDPYVDLQEWFKQGYYEAKVQCKNCYRNGLRWVKETKETERKDV
jgi:hypothetical protein